MQAICCRLFQSASSSSVRVFCTYSIADKSPANSLTMLWLETKTKSENIYFLRQSLTTCYSQFYRRNLLETRQILPQDAEIPQVTETHRGSCPMLLPAASGPALLASVLAAASSAWSRTGCFHSDPACLWRKEKLPDLREHSDP